MCGLIISALLSWGCYSCWSDRSRWTNDWSFNTQVS